MLRQHTLQRTTHKLWPVVLGLVVMTLFLSACGGAQPKVYHVGILNVSANFTPITDGFKSKMTELGYVEGQNIVYDAPNAEPDKAKQQSILKRFVDEKVDLIFAYPTEGAVPAKAAAEGTNIPVLFANANIEGINLVASVREPGGNITGVRAPGPEQVVKRLEILHELLPQAKRIYLPYDPNSAQALAALEQLRLTPTAAAVTIVEGRFAKAADLQADLDARSRAADPGMDAIMMMPTSLSSSKDGFAALSKFAADHKLPVAGSTAFPVDQGALFDNIVVPLDEGKLAAPLADKILKGVPAGTIPVVSGDQVLRINYKVAQQLGVTVPPGLLQEAAQIIR